MLIGKTELNVSGRILKIAKLRHEWFEYLAAPAAFIPEVRQARVADILTFLQEAHVERPRFPYPSEPAGASMVTFKSFDDWWNGLHFKARNKARKVQKTGVELRPAKLDDEFVRGVKKIYDEEPLRQGRKFTHFGKSLAQIREDLSSFPECTFFIGAYFQNELIGFMKLFEGDRILRTVHIIATFEHRDKCVMDALIAKGVELASAKGIHHFHYGDWAYRGLGVFRLSALFCAAQLARRIGAESRLAPAGARADSAALERPFDRRAEPVEFMAARCQRAQGRRR